MMGSNADEIHVFLDWRAHTQLTAPIQGFNLISRSLPGVREILAARHLRHRERARMAKDLFFWTQSDFFAFRNDDNLFRNSISFLKVVSHIERNTSKGGKRLNEQKRLRINRQGPSQRRALLLAAGKLPGITIFQSLKLNPSQLLRHSLSGFVTGQVAQAEADVFRHRHVREERVILQEESHAAFAAGEINPALRIEKRSAIQNNPATAGRFETRNRAQRHAFARAGRPQNSQCLLSGTEGDFQLEVFEFPLNLDQKLQNHPRVPLSVPRRLRPQVLNATRATEAIPSVMSTQARACLILPASAAKKIAMGSVWVFPGMLPAIISVAPNSPRARAKARMVPAMTPGHASGSATFQKALHSEAPSVRAAWRKLGFTCSSAPRAERYISGKATTVAAITVAGHEKST